MTGILKVDTIQSSGGATGLTINSNGLIKPKTVSFRVEATDIDQNITNGKLQWEDVRLDTGNYWDSTNHRFTPGVAGWYLFGGVVRVATSSAGDGSAHNLMDLSLYKNGSHYIRNQLQTSSDIIINGSYALPTSMMELNGSGDYVEAFFASDEAVIAHDHASVPSEFWGMLVHAT